MLEMAGAIVRLTYAMGDMLTSMQQLTCFFAVIYIVRKTQIFLLDQ